MKHKKIIIFGSVIFIIFVIFVITVISSSIQQNQTQTLVTPTPVQNPNQGNTVIITPTIKADKQLEKAIDILQQRPQLSASDQQTKSVLISKQQQDVDAIYSTDTYRVDYIQPLDEFQVEIDSPNVSKAMSDAITWFELQGMSKDGICKLPVIFYGNSFLKEQNIQVPDLADGC